MDYLVYSFNVEPLQPGSDILIAHLAGMGFESFDTTESGFKAYAKAESKPEFKAEEFQFEDFSYTYTVERINQVNWNQEWEKNFEPVSVGQQLLIRAPFHPHVPGYKYEMVIMPKMSFGTGHHQTTRLMCEAMLEQDFTNKKVLDMGCGTGILAILAKQLGAKDVLGIDVDEWSVENSKENCMKNGVGEIRILKGDAESLLLEREFDVVLANINKNILKKDLRQYVNHMKHGALLFLSGFFYTDQEEMVEYAEAQGMKFLNARREEEWAMLLFSKK